MQDQVQLLELNGGLAVDPGVRGPEHDFSGLWADQPSVLIVGLVRQSGGDLLEVKAAQIKQKATVIPAQGPVPSLAADEPAADHFK